jgi:hypothetical protein
MPGSRSLPHAARTTERFQPEDAGSGAPRASYVWDRALDGPEEFVVTRAPSGVSRREFGNGFLRSALLALVTCGYIIEFVRSVVEHSDPAWSAFMALLSFMGVWACALDPELPRRLRRVFQLMRHGNSGGGPQRPAAG